MPGLAQVLTGERSRFPESGRERLTRSKSVAERQTYWRFQCSARVQIWQAFAKFGNTDGTFGKIPYPVVLQAGMHRDVPGLGCVCRLWDLNGTLLDTLRGSDARFFSCGMFVFSPLARQSGFYIKTCHGFRINISRLGYLLKSAPSQLFSNSHQQTFPFKNGTHPSPKHNSRIHVRIDPVLLCSFERSFILFSIAPLELFGLLLSNFRKR